MKHIKCFLIMAEAIACKYKLSEYNLYLDENKGLVYNMLTQALAAFEDRTLKVKDVPELLENGFIVDKDTDELIMMKKEYDAREQLSDELHLIIATTLDCQFRCFYCYEEHPKVYMGDEIKQSIAKLVDKHAATGKNISIVWYGGEPLLDITAIRTLTAQFKGTCTRHGVDYKASMISNGYQFNEEIISSLDGLQIESIQITVDGMREIHETRRPMIGGATSFDRIIENMIQISRTSHAQVHLRINIDKSNAYSAHELLDYCTKMGLADIDVNLGMMKEFGCDHSCVSRRDVLFTMKEFSDEFLRFRDQAKQLGFASAVDKMVPEYKVNPCTVDAPNSYVIDPYGFVYKCISLVGKKDRSIGNILTGFNENAHIMHSPFRIERCRTCKYFPVCKGGCLLNNEGRASECNIWRFITEDLVLREMK